MNDGRIALPPLDGRRGNDGARANWYLIFVLTLAYTASFIDRQVLNLLVGPLKAQYQLSDVKLSLLQGFAFTLSYIVMSPVFGRLSDTRNRRNVLLVGVLVWSVGTMACGLSHNFGELFAARLLIGGAEACLTPTAWSLISDSFSARRVPRAFSIYMMGPYLGGGMALIFGGLLLGTLTGLDRSSWPAWATFAPWQLIFMAVGLPGLVVAILLAFVREPARHVGPADEVERASLRDVARGLMTHRGFYLNFYLGTSMLLVTLYAFPAWMPAVLMRQFGATSTQAGVHYGGLVLASGILGVLTGPWLAGHLARRGRTDALVLVPCLSLLLLIPVSAALLVVPSYPLALVVASIAAFLYSLPQALASAALQLATPNRMRGIATAIFVFVVTVMGLGVAPTIIAFVTDHILRDERKVGSSLGMVCAMACALGAVLVWRCLPAYRRMIAQDVAFDTSAQSPPLAAQPRRAHPAVIEAAQG